MTYNIPVYGKIKDIQKGVDWMNKTNYLLAILTGAFILLTATIVIAVSTQRNQSVSKPINTASTTTCAYIMKEYQGKIGIFLPTESEPYEILPTDISVLPEFDQIALRQGIELQSKQELNRLIEDFDG